MCACVRSTSLRRLFPKVPPRFAFDSRRYVAIASITESGHCVPPGPSRKAVAPCSAEKRARTASTSRATMLIVPDATALPSAREHSVAAPGTTRHRRSDRPRSPLARDRAQRQPQHVRGGRVRALGRPARRRLRRWHAVRGQDPQRRAGGRLVGPAGAGRALLGAAARLRPDHGAARELLAGAPAVRRLDGERGPDEAVALSLREERRELVLAGLRLESDLELDLDLDDRVAAVALALRDERPPGAGC